MDVRDAEKAVIRRGVWWTLGFLLAAPLVVGVALVLPGIPRTPSMIAVGVLMLIAWCCIGIRATQLSLQRSDA